MFPESCLIMHLWWAEFAEVDASHLNSLTGFPTGFSNSLLASCLPSLQKLGKKKQKKHEATAKQRKCLYTLTRLFQTYLHIKHSEFVVRAAAESHWPHRQLVKHCASLFSYPSDTCLFFFFYIIIVCSCIEEKCQWSISFLFSSVNTSKCQI